MARRERKKDTVFRETVDMLAETILKMPLGERASINPLVYYHYSLMGYEKKDLGGHIGYALTKDGGKTYLLKDEDLFEVMEQLKQRLKGKRKLDLSAYKGTDVGMPYNLTFVVLGIKKIRKQNQMKEEKENETDDGNDAGSGTADRRVVRLREHDHHRC